MSRLDLKEKFDFIIHTTPPFYDHPPLFTTPSSGLRSCYQSSFQVIENLQNKDNNRKIAVPLVGAGARGFPVDEAISIAAQESTRWRETGTPKGEETIAFGILEEYDATRLAKAIQDAEF
eukprot:CAMPEP_0118721524 /NCGR_PEP_ID=MMETSP0800-20121206/30781_1 /TAXON_ID=210618 ORGANISM="Striatella unipunctata, Strain CCMP2910" /NCGR_SAMPLE_ID=MMETSP0800 /ASSEMBLY_ACC=CAM_ASM_000638 /LENGTH=119 /DNA_ID=CAMNT_0006629419 /DNA_START=130 /DNA_END=489 /DNA_ORIENTATION=+